MRTQWLYSDPPGYGDRKRTVDRRGGERRTAAKDRRKSYPGAGRDARLGHCRECGERTALVVLFGGKPANLCAPCGQAIRGGV